MKMIAPNIDGRFNPACTEGGNSKTGNVDAIHEVEARDFRSHIKLDEAVVQNFGGELESDAKLLVLNCQLVSAARSRLKNGHRNLTAGEEINAASPDSKYTKHRELPPEADKLMEKFYLADPVESVGDSAGCGSARA